MSKSFWDINSKTAGLCCIIKESKKWDTYPSFNYDEGHLSLTNLKGVSEEKHLSKWFLKILTNNKSYEIKLHYQYNTEIGENAKIWLFNNNLVLVYFRDNYFFRSTIETDRQFIKLSKDLSEEPSIEIDFEKEGLKEKIDILENEVSSLKDDFNAIKAMFKNL